VALPATLTHIDRSQSLSGESARNALSTFDMHKSAFLYDFLDQRHARKSNKRFLRANMHIWHFDVARAVPREPSPGAGPEGKGTNDLIPSEPYAKIGTYPSTPYPEAFP
jgi:hypothetical protein